MDVLTLRDLTKSFGDKKVLTGINLSIPEHSIFGFVGKNGAGKTTTMAMILGFLKSDHGEIQILGEPVHYGQTKTNRYIGYLPDVPEFYSYMTPMEYLKLCGEISNMTTEEIAKRSKELLQLVGLDNETHRIKGFSRGMKQRLGIAQALLNRPRLLICDEPTSALDPAGRKEILDILLALKEETTVIFSTHILSDVERICSDVAFLNDGKIVMEGSVNTLRELHCANEFIVEVQDNKNKENLLQAFKTVCRSDKDSLVFTGDQELMNKVLRYLVDYQIPIQKIEKKETSLEALFLEVTK